MGNKIRAHDLTTGVLYGGTALLAAVHSTNWLWATGAVAALQIVSPLTRFCPVYAILNKVMPHTDPVQDGSRA